MSNATQKSQEVKDLGSDIVSIAPFNAIIIENR